jgi:hypothetical protein
MELSGIERERLTICGEKILFTHLSVSNALTLRRISGQFE